MADFDTKAALMKSGKAEFLEHGFEGASLRAICTRAHVTTGAFYAHFRHKEDLFEALVKDDLSDYLGRYNAMLDRLAWKIQLPCDTETDMMDYLVERRDLFRLLFDCSNGTKYARFKDEFITHFEKTFQVYLDAYAPGAVNSDVTKALVQMKFSQCMYLLYSEYDRERIRATMDRLQVFTQAGLGALLETRFDKRPA
ncbi:TetR/AcrR family transcriptional regulator [Xiamenia xianingshaonis]|uniref:TetR/AcrR family transcriptional regulator n=1 Tax=Xiamenia xianingshaonis TaxID=2682776 RepID=UPI0013EBE645|nr:TetR/AcrR family transcriptional regulator [Xiamenia xianingshaonis]